MTLGIVQITALLTALVYLNSIKLNGQKMLIALLVIYLPSIMAVFYVSQVIGIVWLLFSITVLFYIATKTKWILVDVCLVTMIGIFADHCAQLLQNMMTVYENWATVCFLFFFLILFILLTLAYNHLFKKKAMRVCFSVKNQVIVSVLAITTVVVFYLNAFVLHDKKLLLLNIIVQMISLASH